MKRIACEDFSGRTIAGGRFTLAERLGYGAFGAVYRAVETSFGEFFRQVAVKLTHARWLRPEDARKLLQEGFTIAKIMSSANPAARAHLIHVYEMGLAEELERRAFLAMEFVPGVRLLRHIESFGPSIPMATARRYFCQLCAALAPAHELDPAITHGDLKPDNVLVDCGQTIRIVDFGLAKPVDRLAGYVLNPQGCLRYTAPEALLGRGLPQSDIYSLGLIMYEVLTGDGPHRRLPEPDPLRPAAHYYREKRKLRFDSLGAENRSVAPDPAMFRLVERCCRFDYHERHGSIGELLRELDAAPGGPREPDISEAGESPPETFAPDETWQERAAWYAEANDGEAGLRWLEASGNVEPPANAYRAVFLNMCGRHGEAIECGEAASEGPALPAGLRFQLVRALYEAAQALAKENPDYVYRAEYYRSRMNLE